jgi:hypothetical protein
MNFGFASMCGSYEGGPMLKVHTACAQHPKVTYVSRYVE